MSGRVTRAKRTSARECGAIRMRPNLTTQRGSTKFRFTSRCVYFSVLNTGSKQYQLPVLPMGFRPSCQVANTITEVISDVGVFRACCVDNILFLGSREDVIEAAQRFVDRSAQVGAILKDTNISVETSYDFLGERYDHIAKTRALTQKTQAKAEYAAQHLRGHTTYRTRQLMAIYGLLLYCSNTLRVCVAKYHWAMRWLSHIATTDLTHEHTMPDNVRTELITWAQIAATKCAGVMNPADERSRTTFGPDTSGATTSPSRTPKYLPVTHIGGFTERHKVKRGEWGRVDGMASSRV